LCGRKPLRREKPLRGPESLRRKKSLRGEESLRSDKPLRGEKVMGAGVLGQFLAITPEADDVERREALPANARRR